MKDSVSVLLDVGKIEKHGQGQIAVRPDFLPGQKDLAAAGHPAERRIAFDLPAVPAGAVDWVVLRRGRDHGGVPDHDAQGSAVAGCGESPVQPERQRHFPAVGVLEGEEQGRESGRDEGLPQRTVAEKDLQSRGRLIGEDMLDR